MSRSPEGPSPLAAPSAVHHRDPSRLAPEYVRRIARYIPGKPIDELAREFGLDERDIIKLASNENPRGPSPAVRAAIAAATEELSPLSRRQRLRAQGGARRALSRVAPTRSCSATARTTSSSSSRRRSCGRAITPSIRATRSRSIRSPRRRAAAIGIEVPALDMGHDLQAMRAAITPTTRIVFVANPNNPTGTWIAPAALEAFIASVPEDVLVVLDEAYNEYLEPQQQRAQRRVDREVPEPDRLAHVLEGVRARRAARRLRNHASRRSPTC